MHSGAQSLTTFVSAIDDVLTASPDRPTAIQTNKLCQRELGHGVSWTDVIRSLMLIALVSVTLSPQPAEAMAGQGRQRTVKWPLAES